VLHLFKYLKFLLTATNQHGVHSPFIYGYVTKGLYSKNQYSSSKNLNVLLKSIAYFNVQKVQLSSSEAVIKTRIHKEFPNIEFVSQGADVFYILEKDIVKIQMVLTDAKNFNNNTLLLIDGIYKSNENRAVWEALKQDEKITVTVDLFFCGAVFFRKEQAKEHFRIRI